MGVLWAGPMRLRPRGLGGRGRSALLLWSVGSALSALRSSERLHTCRPSTSCPLPHVWLRLCDFPTEPPPLAWARVEWRFRPSERVACSAAGRSVQSAHDIGSAHTASAHSAAGRVAGERGLDGCVRLNSDCDTLRRYRARARRKAGRLEEALKDAEMAVELQPTASANHMLLGHYLQEARLFNEAGSSYMMASRHGCHTESAPTRLSCEQ